MLILSRRPNESLRIGREIVVTVLGLNGNQIRIGITAPQNVAVDREEVHQRKVAERAATRDLPAVVVTNAVNDSNFANGQPGRATVGRPQAPKG